MEEVLELLFGEQIINDLELGIHYPMDDATSYELNDHLGNVRAVISRGKKNGLADVLTYTDYYPFGSVLRSGGIGYRYGFQGEFAEEDEETGWNSFELRMYDPVIGRWMVPDPERQYFSPYLAFGNNPINRVDPDGGLDIEPLKPKGPDLNFTTPNLDFMALESGLTPAVWLSEVTVNPAFSNKVLNTFNAITNFLSYLDSFVGGGGYGYYNSEKVSSNVLHGRNPDGLFNLIIMDPYKIPVLFDKFKNPFIKNKFNYDLKPSPKLTLITEGFEFGSKVHEKVHNLNEIKETVTPVYDTIRGKIYDDEIFNIRIILNGKDTIDKKYYVRENF